MSSNVLGPFSHFRAASHQLSRTFEWCFRLNHTVHFRYSNFNNKKGKEQERNLKLISKLKEFEIEIWRNLKLKFEQGRKQCLSKNLIASNKWTEWSFFPYDLVTVNDYLSDTLEKGKSGTNSSLQNIRKDNLTKLIFAHMNINSIRNKFDSLADIIKDNIDILMISESKN